MAHIHPIIDADDHFVIDPVTRKIIPETPSKNSMVQYDHNSERYTFEIPRYVEGHDMSLCNLIQVHYINTASSGKEKNLDLYEVDDMELTEINGEEKVFFSWLISKNATLYNGGLVFAIRFACTNDDIVEYDWHTDIFSGISITLGINNSAVISEEYSDVLEAWKQKVFTGALVNSNDVDNPISLRDMDSGTYGLYGSFVPYTGSSYVMTFSSNIIASIIREETKSSVQIWYPINNSVWFLEISDDDYTFTETRITEINELTINTSIQLTYLSNALADEITRAEEAEEAIRNTMPAEQIAQIEHGLNSYVDCKLYEIEGVVGTQGAGEGPAGGGPLVSIPCEYIMSDKNNVIVKTKNGYGTVEEVIRLEDKKYIVVFEKSAKSVLIILSNWNGGE